MDYIDVPSSVKDGAVRDWLMDESRLAFQDDCNVVSYSMVDSVDHKDVVSHHVAYITGFDENGDCILESTMPDGFLISGTHKADCPIRGGLLMGDKGLVTIRTKDTVFIVVDNQEEYDEALKDTCVADCKVVQVDDNNPMSALEVVSLTDTSKVDYCVVVHSDKYFDYVDEHIDRSLFDDMYHAPDLVESLRSDFYHKNKNFGMVLSEHNMKPDLASSNALGKLSLCVMPSNPMLGAPVVDDVKSVDDFVKRFPAVLEGWKQDAEQYYPGLVKSYKGFYSREQFDKDVSTQYESFTGMFQDVQKVHALTSRGFNVCRGKEPGEVLVMDSGSDSLLMSVSVSKLSDFSKAFSESLPYVDYDYLAKDFTNKDKTALKFGDDKDVLAKWQDVLVGVKHRFEEDLLKRWQDALSGVKQRFEEADAVMKKIDSGELDMPVEYQLDGSRKLAEHTQNKGR